MKILGLYHKDGLHIAHMSVLKRKALIQGYNSGYGQFFVLNEEALVYKQLLSLNHRTRVIATLMLPAGAIVFLTDGPERYHKCRASEALVLTLESIKTGRAVKKAMSFYDCTFTYQAHQYVVPKEVWQDRYPHHGRLMSEEYDECKPGIHFFRTFDEAINYNY